MLVSGRANRELAAKIADKLGVALSGVSLRTFANGEVYCRFEESVRGADVFIVQPTCANAAEGLTANDALMELLMMVDAAVGGSAHRVIAVTPWYGYSRQDKKSAPREPISARLVARMLESAGIDRILTMDLHSGQIQGFFQKPCDHMTALLHPHPVLRRPRSRGHRRRRPRRGPRQAQQAVRVEDRRRPRDPQQGAPRAAGRRDQLRDRRRPRQDGADRRRHHRYRRHAPGGGRRRPRRRARCGSTRPRRTALFSGNAWENLAAAGFEEIVVTDTVPIPPGALPNVRTLSCADLLTSSIRQIFTDGSVSDVFGGENQLF